MEDKVDEESLFLVEVPTHTCIRIRGVFEWWSYIRSSHVVSSLHCGTRYLIAVLALRLAGAPLGGDRQGGQVRFLGDFGVLVYPPKALLG